MATDMLPAILSLDISSQLLDSLPLDSVVAFLQASKHLYSSWSLWFRVLSNHRRQKPLACPQGLDISKLAIAELRTLAQKTCSLLRNWQESPTPRLQTIRSSETPYNERLFCLIPGTGLLITTKDMDFNGILYLTCWDLLTPGPPIGKLCWNCDGFAERRAPLIAPPGTCTIPVILRDSKYVITVQVDYRDRKAVTFEQADSLLIDGEMPWASRYAYAISMSQTHLAVLCGIRAGSDSLTLSTGILASGRCSKVHDIRLGTMLKAAWSHFIHDRHLYLIAYFGDMFSSFFGYIVLPLEGRLPDSLTPVSFGPDLDCATPFEPHHLGVPKVDIGQTSTVTLLHYALGRGRDCSFCAVTLEFSPDTKKLRFLCREQFNYTVPSSAPSCVSGSAGNYIMTYLDKDTQAFTYSYSRVPGKEGQVETSEDADAETKEQETFESSEEKQVEGTEAEHAQESVPQNLGAGPPEKDNPDENSQGSQVGAVTQPWSVKCFDLPPHEPGWNFLDLLFDDLIGLVVTTSQSIVLRKRRDNIMSFIPIPVEEGDQEE